MSDAKQLVAALVDDVKDFVSDFGVQGMNPEALEPLFELTVSKHLPQPATLDVTVAELLGECRDKLEDLRLGIPLALHKRTEPTEKLIARIDAFTGKAEGKSNTKLAGGGE